ncbi:Angiotensin-converting enzyme [Holothuria leucospilota]|uniref:Angiotensin-converting enzyme n=1 Tax=Holothuria leucospilota TaxID=206669 RepID=A0A9Q1H292_HOLLE|nr:Angiotensin-converting enzyme [Holothuria leucospilota]
MAISCFCNYKMENKVSLLVWGLIVFVQMTVVNSGTNTNEEEAIQFLDEFNTEAQIRGPVAIEAAWTYNTNITDHNQRQMTTELMKIATYAKQTQLGAQQFDRTNFSYDVNRQLEKMLYIGDAALNNPVELLELMELKAKMQARYSTGEVCLTEEECYPLDPDLTETMASSRNYDELYWAWDGWRDAVGVPARQDFERYVELKNKAALANDQPDCGAFWRSWYEVDNLEEQLDALYTQLSPLYTQLHAYVRRRLYDLYGPDYVNPRGPIPAHLLGNMWAQSWINLMDDVVPYPGKPSVDITPVLQEENYTPLQMFEISDEFFKSIGLIEMPQEFWDESMIEKPTDGREVVCHASAWEFINKIDYRIKMCTDINMDDFITIHHEMGHVEYFLQYKEQPVVYHTGANPGFHEAVGDVLALSVSTPKHLNSIGLLKEVVEDYEADINYLMSIALDKIAFLPFSYLLDLWRWGVFDGSITPDEYNQKWWDLRLQYQGILPPTERTEDDFDPASKYHVAADTPYIRYFISYIIQFQFHKALCDEAGHEGSLYTCDIYRSEEAGQLLANMLQQGGSLPWPDQMEQMTGQRDMDAGPLLEYFEPLINWLEEENEGEELGWDHDTTWRPKEPGEWDGSSAASNHYSLAVILILLASSLFLSRL